LSEFAVKVPVVKTFGCFFGTFSFEVFADFVFDGLDKSVTVFVFFLNEKYFFQGLPFRVLIFELSIVLNFTFECLFI